MATLPRQDHVDQAQDRDWARLVGAAVHGDLARDRRLAERTGVAASSGRTSTGTARLTLASEDHPRIDTENRPGRIRVELGTAAIQARTLR